MSNTQGFDAKAGRWSLAASTTSILSAFVASICCVGPLVFALLGITGAGLLVNLTPYRPYFMAATFALLGAGFYMTYGTRRTVAVDGPACDCLAPRTNRAGRIMLWVASVFVAGFLAFPYFAAWIWG